MIERITLRDFAVARDLTVELGPGLNVFTGETGAGKSLLVDALAFAFGGRRGREVIATGADRAVVQVAAVADGAPFTIERSITIAGRSSARLGDIQATVEELLRLGAAAIDIHGQSEQMGLLRPAVQRDLLDAYGDLDAHRAPVTAAVRDLREIRRSMALLQTDARERERRLEQLRFEADEIASAALVPAEDDVLHAERRRLAEAGALLESSAAALDALDAPAIGELVAAVDALNGRDPSPPLQDLALAIDAAAADLRRELRHYRDSLEEDPARLETVEARLDLIARLRRKYGETIDAVLAYGDNAAAELRTLEESGVSLEELSDRERERLTDLTESAFGLSIARREAAQRLVAAVSTELEQLGMGGGALAVGFETTGDPSGPPLPLPDFERVDRDWTASSGADPQPRDINESGADRVEFLASFNPGQDPRPLAAVASGGETSRFLLALSAVFAATAPPRTIVFDEVDEGVGGRAGSLVGAALRRLAASHQVLCITHLPQVAAFADRHYVVTKQDDGVRTWSTIESIDGEARIAELAAMLGGVTPENTEAARALLNVPGSPTDD